MSSTSDSLANLVATIDSVAMGVYGQDEEDDEETQIVTAEMLGGTVLHLADGQAINVVQMTGSIEDTINVVQVETTELTHQVSSVEEICTLEIDSEEQKRILSETGAHVVVKTEESSILPSTSGTNIRPDEKPVLPTIPFSFPGQTFDTKCQKLILNVWDFFRRVKKNPDLLEEIRTPQERAAACLHISAATIGKIGKNFKKTGKLETPGKKRKRNKPVVDSVDREQEDVIRKIIKEFKDSRITPTLPLILAECRERINFQGGATSFRRILQRMGFKGLSTKTMGPIHAPKLHKPVATTSYSLPTTNSHVPVSPIIKKITKKEPTYELIPVLPSPSKKSKTEPLSQPLSVVSNKIQSVTNVSKQFQTRAISNFLGGNILQLGTNFKGEPVTLSQQTANAIANATSRLGEGPQTIHVLQPDNTIQQIQIVYANVS